MHVTLPANTSALIHFPTPEIKEMREADRHIQQSQGIKLHRIERDRVIFEAGSGDYRFSMPWPPKPPGR